jgi:hypothetical protein
MYNGKIIDWIEAKRSSQIAKMVSSKSRFDMIIALITKQYNKGHNILVLGDHVLYLQHIVKTLRDSGISNSHYFVGQYYDMDPLPPLEKLGKLEKFAKYKKTMKSDVKKDILRNARVLCATYGTFKEGISETRLDMGIDVTPRSDFEQSGGRVRRIHEGKTCSYWYSIVDTQNAFASRAYNSRLEEYMRLAETVKIYDPDTGTIRKIK